MDRHIIVIYNYSNRSVPHLHRRRLHRARGHVSPPTLTNGWARGHVSPPHFNKWLGTGGTVSRRTANKKLTKLYLSSRKRSPKRVIVVVKPEKWRGATEIFPACVPRPTFKFVPAPLPISHRKTPTPSQTI